MDLSIIIVSYNARADLARCLESLRASPPQGTHEVIVVDNASRDDSVAAARAAGATVLTLDANRGFAAANNAGIRASHGELLLLLNSDTIVPPGAIDRLRKAFLSTPGVGVAGPRLVDGNGRAELSFGPMIALGTERRQQRLMAALARNEPAAREQVDRLTRIPHFPDWVTGACLMVRREDADTVGLLDERFFMYTEDVDFCAAIRALGKRVLFTPDAEIVHLRGRSAASAPEATRRAYVRSHVAFYEKHHPLQAPLVKMYHWIRG